MLRLSLISAFALAGCVSGGNPGGDDGGDDAPDGGPDAYVPPVVQYDYAGSYEVQGTWDLSAPFGGDGIGGLVADLLIDQIVSLAGVPGPLEDEATDAIAGQIRQPIVDQVNAVVPAELLTSSPTMQALDAIFSAIAVEGALDLVAGTDPDFFSGTEHVTRIAATHQSTVVTVSMAELLEGGVEVAGSVSGSAVAADTLAIGQHPLQIRFGMLVAIIARDALGVDVFALGDQALAAIVCADVVDEITGGADAYAIRVGGMDFSVPASTLVGACDDLKLELADAALGMFARDAGIRLGGNARLSGGGNVASTVTSEPGYGGAITALPVPVEPQVSAAFTAAR